MNVVIEKNVIAYKQVPGFGQRMVTFNAIANLSQVISKEEKRDFILHIEVIAKPNIYTYSYIFGREQIDEQGDLLLGTISMIEPMDPLAIVLKAKVVFLDYGGAEWMGDRGCSVENSNNKCF